MYGAVKWHSCAKGWFHSCETPFEIASRLRSGGFQGVEISQPFRSCETGVLGCEMALVCQGVSSQLQNFSQRALGGCEMVSQRKLIFAATPEGCEIFFAATHFRLRNFTAQAFSLFLSFFRFLASLFQFPCNYF